MKLRTLVNLDGLWLPRATKGGFALTRCLSTWEEVMSEES